MFKSVQKESPHSFRGWGYPRRRVVEDKLVIYESIALGQPIRMTIEFGPDGTDAAEVMITESTFAMTEAGERRAMGQTAGWTYTLCGLKAFVKFGINLRTGLNKRLPDIEKRHKT